MYQLLLQYTILFVLGVIFIVYASLNISLSYAPENLKDMTQNYGKTYAIPVTRPSNNSNEIDIFIKKTAANAATLMILSMTAGIYLVLFSLYRIYVSFQCKRKI